MPDVNEDVVSVDWWGLSKDNGGADVGEVKAVGSHIYFYSSVDAKSILMLNQLLKEVEVDLLTQGIENDSKPNPLKLHIHSYGGSIFAGIAAMDTISNLRVDVHTIVDGAAASAATFLSVSGKRRFINPNAQMLIHQLSSGAYGKYEEIKDEVKNLDNLMDMIRRTYQEKTRVPHDKLDEILKHDIWFPSEKCLEYGLVDEIL